MPVPNLFILFQQKELFPAIYSPSNDNGKSKNYADKINGIVVDTGIGSDVFSYPFMP